MSSDSGSSRSSQGPTMSLSDFLSTHDDSHFVWDDEDREVSEAWLRPVKQAMLDHKKHKVFTHRGREYLTPPSPFVQHGPELGDSGSTIVYKVTPPKGYAYRRPLALKVIICKESTRPPGPDSEARSNALKEVKTMSKLRHPHIVAYVASFEDYCIQSREVRRRPRGGGHAVLFRVNQRIRKHILGIAMYPPAQWNLRAFMEEVFQSPKEADWILPLLHTFFGCLAQAVAYLHRSSVQVRHKDIKPENIVIDDFCQPILTDFGLSKHFKTGQYSEGPTPKTVKYADPEAMHEGRRDERSDIFSLGCVFLEMATVLLGKPPLFAEEQLSTAAAGDAHSISSSDTSPGPAACEFKYSESLYNLDGYLGTLTTLVAGHLAASEPERARSVGAVVDVLPHIRRMMDGTLHLRPAASTLYPLFRDLCDVYKMPGPCPNCEEERRTGRAIPSRSGSRSPTLRRSATVVGGGHGMGGHGGGGGAGGPSSGSRVDGGADSD
ncbi:kinase-like protein [Parathielavia hyrcaniae]|uniref:non-specific serine/threonine protein kinase n=1 Tax=Parathielavia hyrcaniae TaxID=113614 RepID=A0AAN6Q455_9PEZI|nr:kinase-like protein [Parathielavia hyrcaniae]